MNKASLLALVLALGNSGQALAKVVKKSEGQSSIKVEEVTQKKNKVEGDIDEEITNARMRADSGSKSKFSFSSTITYSGGSINRPFGSERPNIRENSSVETKTAAKISLETRYRWNKNESVTVGTEFGLRTPFQGDIDKNRNQLNVYDPSINYNYAAKIGEIQSITTAGVGFGTSVNSQQNHLNNSFGLSTTALHGFQNGFTLGAVAGADYYTYSTAAKRGGDDRQDYDLVLVPFAEYAFNDTYSARTLVAYVFNHFYGDTKIDNLKLAPVYQSVGLGIAYSRDIYIYPNIQFLPTNLKPEMTNVALQATVNLF